MFVLVEFPDGKSEFMLQLFDELSFVKVIAHFDSKTRRQPTRRVAERSITNPANTGRSGRSKKP